MRHRVSFFRLISIFLLATFGLNVIPAQSSNTGLRGQITDSFGGIVTSATVTAIDAAKKELSATVDAEGDFNFASLKPGIYTIKVSAEGFSPYENSSVKVVSANENRLDIVLSVANAAAEVTINADEEPTVGTEPEANAGALVLRGEDLDSLPDDPEDLNEAIQALAGPSAGVDENGQVFVDGFTGGRLPPKESIREIRVNRNPFAAEFDRLGYGRIEILTKPGTDKYRGQSFFNFNDESFNSRSPFAIYRAPYQSRRYGGNASGPLIAKKASFFFDFERRAVDDNSDINAIIIDPAFNPVTLYQTNLRPTTLTTFSPRLDWQLNETNTLVGRYTYDRNLRENDGVGDFNLASRAYNTNTTQQTLNLTDTAVFSQNIINELRFQYWGERRDQDGADSSPTIRVLDAFTSGGSQIGLSFNNVNRYELQNYTSWTRGTHSLKAGARFRYAQIDNASEQNFAGTYTFGGGSAPLLDANNQIVYENGIQQTTQITSLERYRRTLLFRSFGFSPSQIRAYGGGATQFSISGGDSEINYSQSDFSPFVQDDWRVRPNLTVSFGLRYDWQNNIDSGYNFAPRVAVAWSPKAEKGKKQTTVLRAGFGIFYNNFNESLLSQTLRFNGTTTQQYVITTSTQNGQSFLDAFPNAPSIEQIAAFSVRQTVRRLDDNLRTPITYQSSFSYEKQLPYKTTFSVNYVDTRTRNVFRSRNINAPLANNVRPLPNEGNIFQYESSGRFDQQQLIFSVNNRFSRAFTFSTNYIYSRAKNDTDGLWSFPVNQYDTSGEYSRSNQDIPHRLTFFGTINTFYGIRLNPNIIINSGRPFNITVGRDINRDSLFTERPAFADAQTTEADLKVTSYGNFDINPKSGQTIIPRNYGTGAAFSVVNLRVSREFGFGKIAEQQNSRSKAPASEKMRYKLNLSVNFQNLLNNTNEALPIGNLSSPLFGFSNSGAGRFGGGANSAGNRRIELQLRFNF